jgi:hypothetical protein
MVGNSGFKMPCENTRTILNTILWIQWYQNLISICSVEVRRNIWFECSIETIHLNQIVLMNFPFLVVCSITALWIVLSRKHCVGGEVSPPGCPTFWILSGSVLLFPQRSSVGHPLFVQRYYRGRLYGSQRKPMMFGRVKLLHESDPSQRDIHTDVTEHCERLS